MSTENVRFSLQLGIQGLPSLSDSTPWTMSPQVPDPLASLAHFHSISGCPKEHEPMHNVLNWLPSGAFYSLKNWIPETRQIRHHDSIVEVLILMSAAAVILFSWGRTSSAYSWMSTFCLNRTPHSKSIIKVSPPSRPLRLGHRCGELCSFSAGLWRNRDQIMCDWAIWPDFPGPS